MVLPTYSSCYHNIIVRYLWYHTIAVSEHKTTKNAKLETILVHASFTDDHDPTIGPDLHITACQHILLH